MLGNGGGLNFRQCAQARAPIDKTPTHPYLSAQWWSEKPEKGRFFPAATLLFKLSDRRLAFIVSKMIDRISVGFSCCARVVTTPRSSMDDFSKDRA
jgi:hypothetical protein